MNLIGLSGYMGSGKDTVGYIINCLSTDCTVKEIADEIKTGSPVNYHGAKWQIKKFSQKLKKIASLLTGIAEERFEDQEFKKTDLGDNWKIPQEIWFGGEKRPDLEEINSRMTVRRFLQLLGTDAIRDGLHENAWVNALFSDYIPIPGKYYFKRTEYSDTLMDEIIEGKGFDRNRMEELATKHCEKVAVYPSWIITDVRFTNEAEAIKQRGGIVIRIDKDTNIRDLRHSSETSLDDWKFDYRIDNNSSIEELIENVRKMLIHYNIIENAN